MKRVGVVVPVFNTVGYLSNCIESILAQPYEKLSVVLVDDGSTDGSSEICDFYASMDSRVTVIHQNNLGKLAARYRGALEADCDYLTFVDSDDWILSDTYSRFSDNMEHGTDVISWCIIRFFSEDNQITSSHNYENGFYDDVRFFKEVYPTMIWISQKNQFGVDPSLCNKLIKKELLVTALKDAQVLNVGYGDDVAVIYPLLRGIKTIFFSDDALYYHRQRYSRTAANYFKDQKYHKNLFKLYDFLRSRFINEPHFINQLNMFYAYSIFLPYRGKCLVVKDRQEYLFPFDKVPCAKKIILYGASVVGQSYWRQLSLLKYADEILWVDKNYQDYEQLGVKSISAIHDAIGYDYAVIAVADDSVAKEIRQYIEDNLTDTRTKIIWNVLEL